MVDSSGSDSSGAETFEQMLSGGHHNSLGRTEEVVGLILADQSRLSDLYDGYSSEDELVRLRVSSAFKRVVKAEPEWVLSYVDRFIGEVSQLDQPSAQWTFAQLMMALDSRLSAAQRRGAIAVMKRNLVESGDWIVANVTMEALAGYAEGDKRLASWLVPHLQRLSEDPRKSVRARAEKYLEVLGS